MPVHIEKKCGSKEEMTAVVHNEISQQIINWSS